MIFGVLSLFVGRLPQVSGRENPVPRRLIAVVMRIVIAGLY